MNEMPYELAAIVRQAHEARDMLRSAVMPALENLVNMRTDLSSEEKEIAIRDLLAGIVGLEKVMYYSGMGVGHAASLAGWDVPAIINADLDDEAKPQLFIVPGGRKE